MFDKSALLYTSHQIKDVYTADGDVFAVLLPANKKLAAQPDFKFEKKLVITDAEYESLVKETKKKSNSLDGVDDVAAAAAVVVGDVVPDQKPDEQTPAPVKTVKWC